MNNTVYAVLSILVMAIETCAVRMAPFFLFDRGQEPPRFVTILGKLLPPAVMSVLMVYCLRNVDVLRGSHGIPEAAAILVTVVLHARYRNTLVSICAGTLLYMFLVQAVF